MHKNVLTVILCSVWTDAMLMFMRRRTRGFNMSCNIYVLCAAQVVPKCKHDFVRVVTARRWRQGCHENGGGVSILVERGMARKVVCRDKCDYKCKYTSCCRVCSVLLRVFLFSPCDKNGSDIGKSSRQSSRRRKTCPWAEWELYHNNCENNWMILNKKGVWGKYFFLDITSIESWLHAHSVASLFTALNFLSSWRCYVL